MCQKLPYAPQQIAALFNQLVGAGEQLRRPDSFHAPETQLD